MKRKLGIFYNPVNSHLEKTKKSEPTLGTSLPIPDETGFRKVESPMFPTNEWKQTSTFPPSPTPLSPTSFAGLVAPDLAGFERKKTEKAGTRATFGLGLLDQVQGQKSLLSTPEKILTRGINFSCHTI